MTERKVLYRSVFILGMAAFLAGSQGCRKNDSATMQSDLLFEADRTRLWVERYVQQTIPDSPRKMRYFKLISENSSNYCQVDETFFLETENAETRLGRGKTNSVGCLAFCYHTPGLPYYKDRQALDKLRKAFEGVVSHVANSGRFTWEIRLTEKAYEIETHEHAWRLEPLFLGYLWIKNDLTELEQKNIEAALKRAAGWLYDHPKPEYNNRGIVWASMLALCGIYFEEPDWLKLARNSGDEIFSTVVLPDGEVGEHSEEYAGGGPDINYTYTSLAYLYAYRLWTGAHELDPLLSRAGRWLTGYNTLSQWPVATGASVRTTYVNTSNFRDCLPLFERLSKSDSRYTYFTERALHRIENSGASAFIPGVRVHTVSPAIWALIESGGEFDGRKPAEWLENRTNMYSHPNVQYALISRQYQTGLVFVARSGWRNDRSSLYRRLPAEGMPLRGLQVWAWDEEDPFILHGDGGKSGRHSYTTAGGINSAAVDVSEGPGGREIHLQKGSVSGAGSDLTTIIERRSAMWTLYAFTPVSTVIVYGGSGGRYETRWYMNQDYLPVHSVDTVNRVVMSGQAKGRLYYLKGAVSSLNDRVEIVTEKGPVAFGFSNDLFKFSKHDSVSEILEFSDASGAYRIDLAEIVRNGNIDRGAPVRLTIMKRGQRDG